MKTFETVRSKYFILLAHKTTHKMSTLKLISSKGLSFVDKVIKTGQKSCRFHTGIVSNMPIKVGDKLPAIDLYEDNPGNKVNTQEAFGKGKHVIFAIPGAFTPTCQRDHFPTFISNYESLKQKGVDSLACISVNDPFVMEAFGKEMKADGKIRMLADTCGTFTRAIDLSLDVSALLGNIRSQRYAMVIQDGKVTGIQVEPDSGKMTCSSASSIMTLL